MAPYGDIRRQGDGNGVGPGSDDALQWRAANQWTPGAPEIQYLAVLDLEQPYLLARVRWPDVFQAISPMRPDWQDDPGLFDLPYSPSSVALTLEQAAGIAAEWGAHIPANEGDGMPRRALMRRMPADWERLSRAERNAWSIEDVRKPKRARVDSTQTERQDAPSSSEKRRWRRRSKDAARVAEPTPVWSAHDDTHANVNGNGNGNGNGHGQWEVEADFIDLTDDVIDLTDDVIDLTDDVIDLRDDVIDLTEAEAGVGVTAEDA